MSEKQQEKMHETTRSQLPQSSDVPSTCWHTASIPPVPACTQSLRNPGGRGCVGAGAIRMGLLRTQHAMLEHRKRQQLRGPSWQCSQQDASPSCKVMNSSSSQNPVPAGTVSSTKPSLPGLKICLLLQDVFR